MSHANGVVMGDGYQTRGGPIVVGGNQDPCIFSDVLVHSFCRIVRRAADNFVRELDGNRSRLLSELVKANDVVFYGKPSPHRHVAVDTVLVVKETVPFQTMSVSTGTSGNTYAYNISDARPGGWHEGETRHTIIVGQLDASGPAVDELTTSFVPQASKDVDGRWQVLRIRREDATGAFDDLMTVFTAMFSGPGRIGNSGYIAELPSSAGETLARAVISRSGSSDASGVFVPPLRPRGSLPQRFSGDAVVRTHELHLARLS